MKAEIKIALAGNPNAGKTTLFNRLTGARQHVGNYPGVTVEQKEGRFSRGGIDFRVVDLPGTYSLTAYSEEELVAREYLVNEKPDVVIDVVDGSNLERNLYLACQFRELGIPLILALNMIDVARDRGIEIRPDRLSKLFGVPVVPIIARSGHGIDQLLDTVVNGDFSESARQPLNISYGEDIDLALAELIPLIEEAGLLTDTYPPRWIALKFLENDDRIVDRAFREDSRTADRLEKVVTRITGHLRNTVDAYPEAIIADHRYGFIKSILRQGVLAHKYDTDRLYTSDRIDRVVTNRLLGPVIMVGVLFALYQFTFSYSEIPVAWCEAFFSWFGSRVDLLMPDGLLKSMIISGIIDGVGGVLGFVPLIMFMFFGISILEDSGYLARVAFMMDRIFRIFGLHGSSVMPFIVSGGIAGGCAVPGVMAARTLRSPRERLATLLTVPFMNCGAKIPVLTLLIGTFFADHKAWYMFLATVAAWLVALLAARLLRSTVLRGRSTPFVMELPPYRFPTFRGLFIHTWERTWQYIKKAGTVILAISILLWGLMSFPALPEGRIQHYEQQRQQLLARVSATIKDELEQGERAGLSPRARQLAAGLLEIDDAAAEERLRYSLAGRLGTALETVSRWAGFDWRTNIALLGGFAAKEVIVSTLGTAYSIGEVDPEQSKGLSERLAADPHWNRVLALAVLAFIMFYAPCSVTVVCIARESGSWGWALFSMAFNTSLAFFLAVVIYQTGMVLGLA